MRLHAYWFTFKQGLPVAFAVGWRGTWYGIYGLSFRGWFIGVVRAGPVDATRSTP